MESPICPSGTRLIETLKWDGAKFVRRDRHLARLRASALALGFALDEAALAAALSGIGGSEPRRVRLTLGMTGDFEMTSASLGTNASEWRATLAKDRLCSDDPLLRHKTTERKLYDRTRAALPGGMDEALFANERGEICEGTITSVFFDIGQGLATPPLRCGCLPGVLRAEMLDSGTCHEAEIHLQDLHRAKLWLGNSLRGLIPARMTP
ncbi:MAG: aminotransferase class IV family protein [Albidovulum sp.]